MLGPGGALLATEEAVETTCLAYLLLMLRVGVNHLLLLFDDCHGLAYIESAPGLHEQLEAFLEPLADAVQVSNFLAL